MKRDPAGQFAKGNGEANTRAVIWDRIARKTRVLVWMVGANILLNLIMLWQISSLLVAVAT